MSSSIPQTRRTIRLDSGYGRVILDPPPRRRTRLQVAAAVFAGLMVVAGIAAVFVMVAAPRAVTQRVVFVERR